MPNPNDTVFAITNAPAAYDYGYTEQVAEFDYVDQSGRSIPMRLVATPVESAGYQHGRYESGLFVVRAAPPVY